VYREGVKIALVSDSHLTPRTSAFDQNWAVIAEWIDRTAPDLVVHLGDITADGVTDSAELDAAFAACAVIGRPMRFLPGNHDIGDNPLEGGPSSEDPLDFERLAHYRRVFGPDWWSLEAGAWRIIGLNAQLFATGTDDEEEQFTWLEEQLCDDGRHVGVLLHKPLFRDGPDDVESHIRYVPASARRRLLACFATCDLRFVIAGHTHQTRRLHVDGVEHVWAPSTAYCIPDAIQERIGAKTVGALALELTEAAHRVELVTPKGLVRHNIMDHAAVYPKLGTIRAGLGARAEL
jgi:3',5'-cyclic AMP phosphodiesterase CpdA